MAFSIKQVKAKLQEYGVPAENLDSAAEYFCSAHKTDLDAIKEQRDTYKADAETLATVQKELDEAREALTTAKNDGWKEKHDTLKKEFEDYKAGLTAKEAKAAKESAVRAYYESKGITGKALEVAMRGSGAEIDEVEIAEDGKIKDSKALDALVAGDFSGLVSTTTTKGVETATPPAGGGSTSKNEPNTRAAQLYAAYHTNLYGETKKE